MDTVPTDDETATVGLRVGFVSGLEESVRPLVDRLCAAVRSDDLFAAQHVIVPTAGVRAWLFAHLADEFGVVANVEVGYLGMLNRFLDPDRRADDDPWSIERVTSVLLDILNDDRDHPYSGHVKTLIANHGGPLRAARYVADRFDRYAARRPHMISQWERGVPALAPQPAESAGEPTSPSLEASYLAQFHLWREVRSRIDREPWPVVAERLVQSIANGERPAGVPPRLDVIGLQSISLFHLGILQALGNVADVRVDFVHPAPVLAREWNLTLSSTGVTPGVIPLRVDPPTVKGPDTMVAAWLSGAWELQCVLASQGVEVESVEAESAESFETVEHLLGRMQAAFRGTPIDPVPYDESDQSIRIHRCHHLSRQAEVIRTAVARAFAEIPGLLPHEVVILCADIVAAAPLLRATFDEPVLAPDGTKVRLPLVVADRSLQQVSEGARLLALLVHAVSGRASIDEVLAVASSPVVLDAVGAGSDDVATWINLVDSARVRWGLNEDHRHRRGLAAPVGDVGSWAAMIRSSLVGAMLPDAELRPEFGKVVPLVGLEVADIDSVTRLLKILDHTVELEAAVATPAPVSEHANSVARAVIGLAGIENPEVAAPLRALLDLAASIDSAVPVPFDEFARLVLDIVDGAPGRQPLRTGSITATSLVPLRGVPYRVVCLMGFDDGALGSGDTAGDDLVSVQEFAGDPDLRLEVRRSIADAVLAARDRVIITTNGRNVRNNTPVPFVTPLAELVDLCGRMGVGQTERIDGHKHSAVEIVHPRHSASAPNFEIDALLPGGSWGVDLRELTMAERMQSQSPSGDEVGERESRSVDRLGLDDLTRLLVDPLRVFVRRGLGINTWIDNHSSPEAVLPLEVDTKVFESECRTLLRAKIVDDALFDVAAWREGLRLRGVLPVGAPGRAATEAIEAMVDGLITTCDEEGVDPARVVPTEVVFRFGSTEVRGVIDVDFGAHTPTIVFVDPTRRFNASATWSNRLNIEVQLLAAIAHGIDVRHAVCVLRHNTEPDRAKAYRFFVDDSVDQFEAVSRLSDLVDAYQQALGEPFPDFGGAGRKLVGDRSTASETFVKYLGDGYRDTAEHMVYGSGPSFDSVYPPGGAVETFFARLASIVTDKHEKKGQKSGGAYRVS